MDERALLDRITVNPAVLSGHPCIRGMRITVANVLRMMAAQHSRERILAAYPALESEDLDACLAYAALLADDRQVELAPV